MHSFLRQNNHSLPPPSSSSEPNMVITQPQDNHMALISNPYPDVYTQMVPQQGDTKRRRRRKKNKAESEGESRKRKLTEKQVTMLETSFENEQKLESERKDQLAAKLGLEPRQVAVWFQNRRARWKNKRLEEEYSKLKSLYDNTVIDKYRVESEVLKLKEQLLEAEKKIHRLSVSERSENSPSSSYSMDVTSIDQQLLYDNQFGMEGFGDVFYMPVENYVYGPEDQWIINLHA